MNPSRVALPAAVLAVASLMVIPVATAQHSGPVSLDLYVDSDTEALKPGIDVPIEVLVSRALPPLTTCMDPEPIAFSIVGIPSQIDKARFQPIEKTPPPTVFTVGGEQWYSEVTLVVRVADDAQANELLPLTLKAEGGGCDGPAGVGGSKISLQIALLVGYVGDVVADADPPQPNSDGTYVWTVRFQNQANGASVVHLKPDEGDGVAFLDYPFELTLKAPTTGEPTWKTVNVVLLKGAAPQSSGALVYQWHPAVVELGPGGEDVLPVDLARVPDAGDPLATDGAAESVPGFEVIPLAAALAAALLLRRRRP